MVAIGHSLGVLILTEGQWHLPFTSAQAVEQSVSRKGFIDGIVKVTQEGTT